MNKSYLENITAEELNNYELSWFRGRIIVVDSLEKLNRELPFIDREKVLGFDTETRPSFKKGRKNKVSLIQLASADVAWLIRINRIGLPDTLTRILGNPAVVKTGVAIHDDLRFLNYVNGFKPSGFTDLQQMVKEYGIQSSGLKKLTAIILGFRISKSQQVTDWEAEELTEAQLIYAATDAWVCREIYCKLTGH